VEDGLNDSEEGVFQNIWRSLAPLKAITFSWLSFWIVSLRGQILLSVKCYIHKLLRVVFLW